MLQSMFMLFRSALPVRTARRNRFRRLLFNNHINQSMSRADVPYDNAFMESCFSRFKAELPEDGIIEKQEDAQTEMFEFIEMYYNPKRRHSSLGCLSLLAFNVKHYLTLSNHPQNSTKLVPLNRTTSRYCLYAQA